MRELISRIGDDPNWVTYNFTTLVPDSGRVQDSCVDPHRLVPHFHLCVEQTISGAIVPGLKFVRWEFKTRDDLGRTARVIASSFC